MRTLGRGASGSVALYYNKRDSKYVAVKVGCWAIAFLLDNVGDTTEESGAAREREGLFGQIKDSGIVWVLLWLHG